MINDDCGFVYEWTNNINGKKYIGSHLGDVQDNYIGSGTVFINAIKKYGVDNFERKILYIGNKFREIEDKTLKEVDAKNNPLYYNLKNDAVGGAFFGEDNGMFGKKHSNETLIKMSETLKSNYTEERKIKHSNDIKGEKNGMYGKNYQSYGIVKRAKENTGKTYEEIFGIERAKKIKDEMSLKRKGKPKNFKTLICPYCNLIGRGPNMIRYHFINCKFKTDK